MRNQSEQKRINAPLPSPKKFFHFLKKKGRFVAKRATIVAFTLTVLKHSETCHRMSHNQRHSRLLFSVVVRAFIMADMGVGGGQDGHGEKVRESLKPVHYDCKNLLGG